VKHILKDSQRVITHEHSSDIIQLKEGNIEMQAIIDQFKSKGNSSGKPFPREEAPITSNQPPSSILIQPTLTHKASNEHDNTLTLGTLKRQLMACINAAI
jgi:hypothetical protein